MNQPAIINERFVFLKRVLPFTYLLSGSTAELVRFSGLSMGDPLGPGDPIEDPWGLGRTQHGSIWAQDRSFLDPGWIHPGPMINPHWSKDGCRLGWGRIQPGFILTGLDPALSQ